jgi:hypothetical protein
MTKTTGEQWKAITHYKNFTFTGKYEISSWGRIRNRETKAELATYSNQRGQGYLKTKIHDTDGKRRALYIHQLVAIYFLDAPDTEGLEINHIDGNTKNNSYTNLEWISHAQNMKEYSRLRRAS